MGLLVRPTGRTSWTNQLDGPAGQTSWTNQFFLFEALASLLIRRFSFSLFHCRSFRVRGRPCFFITSRILHIWSSLYVNTSYLNSYFQGRLHLFEAFIFKVVFITFADFRLLTLQRHIGPLYVNLGGNKLGQRQSQTPI